MSWSNPYMGRKAQFAEDNHSKVRRRKEERAFVRNISQNHSLEALAELRSASQSGEDVTLRVQRQPSNTKHHHQDPSESELLHDQNNSRNKPQVRTISARVRCMETTQGGATLWTAEDDGTIAIRNGATGVVRYTIDSTADLFVESLYATSSHMWVGLSDGSVRVYDPLVFVRLFQGKEHSKSVTCFADSFDAKMFSASLDGSIVKWDGEAYGFTMLTHMPSNGSAVRCLVTYGYNLFVGTDDPTIRCLDTETGEVLKIFMGHQAQITSLLFQDGHLFSTSADCTISVWDVDSQERVHTIPGSVPITAIMGDTVSHMVWAGDQTGGISVYHSTSEHGYAFVQRIEGGNDEDEEANNKADGSSSPKASSSSAGSALLSMRGFVAVDTTKLWTLGSNGINFVWHASKNRVEAQMRQAVSAMDHVLEQDAKELQKWAEFIQKLREVAARLRETMAQRLEDANNQRKRVELYWTWLRWRERHRFRRQAELRVQPLVDYTERNPRQRYFHTWLNFLKMQQSRRIKTNLANALKRARDNDIVKAYYHRMHTFFHLMRKRAQRGRIVESMMTRSEHNLRQSHFALWKQFREEKIRQRKKQLIARNLACFCENYLRRVFYQQWKTLVQKRKLRRVAMLRSSSLALMTRQGAMMHYYYAWKKQVVARRSGKLVMAQITSLMSSTDGNLRRTYYEKWRQMMINARAQRDGNELESNEREIAKRRETLRAVDNLVKRRSLIDDAQRMIDQAKEELQRRLLEKDELDRECDELSAAIAVKRSNAADRQERTVSEQVDDIMALLKSKSLNLHQDFALITKIREKCKNLPASKLFLESHAAIKRIVVELTKKPMLHQEEEWPLSDAQIKKMKGHHSESVLTAIKTMVITFDIMEPQARAQLNTDGEILINAKWIVMFCDTCIENRLKRLGAGAFRVK